MPPLPSWNDGPARKAIVDFVDRVTAANGRDFVPVAERIAVFDNDGTLWIEQPIYVQLAFALDRVRTLAAANPDLKQRQPFKAVLEGDTATLTAGGQKALAQLVAATHSGMTTLEFDQIVNAWIATARHPRFKRLYTDLVYQPMLELLKYLHENEFTTYIVSGGGVEFMRAWAEDIYDVPRERIIGSSGRLRYEMREGKPVLIKLPEIDFVDDGAGKPAGIHKFIARRPIAAFGNSDGDLEMLQWATVGAGAAPRLGVLIHHTDAEREYAYDRSSEVGSLDKALDEASRRGWIVVDMKRDWKTIFR